MNDLFQLFMEEPKIPSLADGVFFLSLFFLKIYILYLAHLRKFLPCVCWNRDYLKVFLGRQSIKWLEYRSPTAWVLISSFAHLIDLWTSYLMFLNCIFVPCEMKTFMASLSLRCSHSWLRWCHRKWELRWQTDLQLNLDPSSENYVMLNKYLISLSLSF